MPPYAGGTMSLADRQISSDVMMIRPVAFAGNPQTRPSNAFQQVDAGGEAAASQAAALREFDGLVAALEQAGVTVHAFEDTPEPHTPDSIFPNNWVSFHADGTVVLYPMLAENRRLERRLDLIEALSVRHGFHAARVIDLTRHEHTGRYLEGTGSLVLDRLHRIAYACVSPRTDLDVLGDFAQQLDYDIVAFEAHDANGQAIDPATGLPVQNQDPGFGNAPIDPDTGLPMMLVVDPATGQQVWVPSAPAGGNGQMASPNGQFAPPAAVEQPAPVYQQERTQRTLMDLIFGN